MAQYLIGDVQGCDAALAKLLQQIAFSPSRDTLYLLGDLVNRGNDNAAVLRRLMQFGDSAKCILGNHDVHLLAVSCGARPLARGDTIMDVLNAPDRASLLGWLRQQPLARFEDGLLMVHAGVLPQWTVKKTLKWAERLSDMLRDEALLDVLPRLWGNGTEIWHSDLSKKAKLRLALNALTRLRFCNAEGVIDFATKSSADSGDAPAGFMPWFEVPERKTQGQPIAFGHWSTLGLLNQPDLIALDTGCVWGGCLSAMRFADQLQTRELIQVECTQSQNPVV